MTKTTPPSGETPNETSGLRLGLREETLEGSDVRVDLPRLRVAFLGLGAIGTPMAGHVAARTRLTVWNRTRAKADAFAAHSGAYVAPTPAEAAQGAEVVITCLPSSIEVEEVVFRPDGLMHGMAKGSVLVDCTSGHPTTSRHIAEQLAERGVTFLDAPVSGGVTGAEAATLTTMVGGSASALDRVRPVLEAFASKIVHVGPIGCGHALKAVNNALLALHIWSTAEGLAILERLGVAPDVALDVINASSGRSNASMNLFPERVLTRAFPNTFRLALLDKDATIAADLAWETRIPAETIGLTARLFAEAHRELGDDADHVEAVKVVERRAYITRNDITN